MRRTLRPIMFVLLNLVGAGACARPRGAGEAPTDTAQAPAAAVAPAEATQVGPARVFEGSWALSRPGGDPEGAGLRLTLAIDSSRGDTLFGRLTSLFSGNVGIDPASFQPFRTSLAGERRVAITIAHVDPRGPALRLGGSLDRDTLFLAMMALGRDTVTRGGADWYLIRRHD